MDKQYTLAGSKEESETATVRQEYRDLNIAMKKSMRYKREYTYGIATVSSRQR